MPTPVAVWLFNEAASGQTPTAVLDVRDDPVNLTITYSGGHPNYNTAGSGRGLIWTGTASSLGNADSGQIGTNKIRTALDGATQATLEWVSDRNWNCGGTPFAITDDSTNNVIFGVNSYEWTWAWQVRIGSLSVDIDQSPDNTGTAFNGIQHYALVVDTPNATAADRVRFYVNGTRHTLPISGIAQNATLSIPSTSRVRCGQVNASGAPIGGPYYAAIYGEAVSASDIATQATALLADNDTDPNPDTGGGAPANAIFFGMNF